MDQSSGRVPFADRVRLLRSSLALYLREEQRVIAQMRNEVVSRDLGDDVEIVAKLIQSNSLRDSLSL
jgi:hypothetical protein